MFHLAQARVSPTGAGKVFHVSCYLRSQLLRYIFVLKFTKRNKFLPSFRAWRRPCQKLRILHAQSQQWRWEALNRVFKQRQRQQRQKRRTATSTQFEDNFFWGHCCGCTSSKKSSVSSNDVEGIINDLITEDQKKVLHHSRYCREKKCSGLRTDEKQRLSNKKDRFQHEWVFEANVSYEKTGLRWLVFVEGQGMYCLTFSMRSLQ